MNMAYSRDIRERALDFCQRGYTDEQVSEKFDVSKHTIGNWKKLLFETGSLEKKKVKRKSGKPYKYTPDKIKELLSKDKSKPETDSKDNAPALKSDKEQSVQKTKKKTKDKDNSSKVSATSKDKSTSATIKPKKKKKKPKFLASI
jgi:transposase